MSVRFDALDRIICIEAELLQYLLVNGVVYGHELLLGEETARCLVFELFVPGVLADLEDVVALLRLNL